ncbi:MAG: hypothetical protein GKS07_04700 [Nitrosopumilus sp.]|nr:MAG: hypothetical protein GKS07_04700 [Nitrosopumilus sp.]
MDISSKLSLISFVTALCGVTLSMWGASWDVTSHLLGVPETFFTPSHMILYSGVGISLVSAILNLTLLIVKKQVRISHFALGSKLIVVGGIMQIVAGPGDFYWHELFGIDGLLSPTHITLALGILVMLTGVMIGFARIRSNISQDNKIIKIMLPTSFGIFWFSVMWLIFFFVLPLSEGDTHNFNPDPYVAIILSFVAIPFVFSIIFWSASKTMNIFGASTASASVFVMMSVTSNILTSEGLWSYLPWFATSMISAIIADYLLSTRIKSKFIQRHREKISGAILGSMFFTLSFPMLSMTFLDVYVFNDVFPYDILPEAANTVFEIWAMTIIPGAIAGMLGMMFASRKLNQIIFKA